ncbi:hypothetical protein BO94DRAFT_609031 [Aspergillus sclerotioniger CBS 115572]|uniref:Condensation domain-containing protein n=1 Tax=Aspergillus sclerotioniger CBS 115572 TaxID=1450535 RepID=A0A317VD41_9EURO|nr:hypothetical protein BO94DRAFT_609031 [Aspergillus sclerotioniger CBS 115572]PWY70802.1 hypothetical protein BO94DRAFT_609031 [Aspergillus sclerotioniger CBS 115572]
MSLLTAFRGSSSIRRESQRHFRRQQLEKHPQPAAEPGIPPVRDEMQAGIDNISFEDTIGPLINVLPFHVSINGKQSTTDYLRSVSPHFIQLTSVQSSTPDDGYCRDFTSAIAMEFEIFSVTISNCWLTTFAVPFTGKSGLFLLTGPSIRSSLSTASSRQVVSTLPRTPACPITFVMADRIDSFAYFKKTNAAILNPSVTEILLLEDFPDLRRVTLHQLVLASVALALQSNRNDIDIVLGAPYFNRGQDDLDTVGLFLEPIPIRIQFPFPQDQASVSTLSFVRAVQRCSQSAIAHAIPWTQLSEAVGASKTDFHNPPCWT